MRRNHQRIIGVVFWIVVATGAAAATQRNSSSQSNHSLGGYLIGRSDIVLAVESAQRLKPGDPFFFQQPNGQWIQVGHVIERVDQQPLAVAVKWYWPKIDPDQCRLIMHENDGSLESVITTLMPPEKRELIQQRLASALSYHGDELSAAFLPLVEDTLVRSLPIVEKAIGESATRHQGEIDQLTTRWKDRIVNDHLVPMARTEIIPIVREHGQPTAETIGRELWESASIWRFGWRLAYDRSPLPDRNLAQQEWERFVEQQAIPIIESHMDEIVDSVQQIVRDVATNDAVRDELKRVAQQIVADPQTRQLVQMMLKEALIDNGQLHQAWSKVWTSVEAQQALGLAGTRLEPVVRQIGDDLFGSKQNGINPDFARVLRNQILGKDRRWVVVVPTDTIAAPVMVPEIVPAGQSIPYPLVHLAGAAE